MELVFCGKVTYNILRIEGDHPMTSNQKPNGLIKEKSPYLLQHAYNPVDWLPWGEKAFDKAKREGKPIFLSIGYSTCHWCHVMAHESFEDEEVADLLNSHYVSIKVDREERPDVDSIYMKVCQMMTGHGGWPLTVVMTPDQIPFYAGTYFPKESKYGRPGVMEMLTQLHRKYEDDPAHISEVTESVRAALKRTVMAKSESRLTEKSCQEAFDQLSKQFDLSYGGFGDAPKFPMPHVLTFLHRHYQANGNNAALDMAKKTLYSMAEGGMYDHIGFGFARYATDETWLVPHFEKMLYDNALLLIAYTEGYLLTKDEHFKKIATEIITFLQREMKGADGAYYSAIDADSEGVEGKYYVWNYDEILSVLGDEAGSLFADVYSISPQGNFEGKNIPNLIGKDLGIEAAKHGIKPALLSKQIEESRQKLLEVREKRVYPHVDDKVLTSWNAMVIAALAKASRVFDQDEYLNYAKGAVAFIEEKLMDDDRLMARYRDGETKYKAYIDDYAYLSWAYLELYEATYSLDYLRKAKHLADQMLALFWDEENGGFFFSGKDSEELIAEDKDVYDGAIPSGNSVAAVMLARIGYLTGESLYLDKVDEMYHSFYDDIKRQASAAPFFLQALQLTENPTKEVVIIGMENDPARQRLIRELNQHFLPHITLLVAEDAERLARVASFAADYKQIENKTTIYICENFACQQPTTDVESALEEILK